MRLLTNNPVKRVGLEAYGLEIVENVPVEITPNKYNERYLKTKKDKWERMGHFNILITKSNFHAIFCFYISNIIAYFATNFTQQQ